MSSELRDTGKRHRGKSAKRKKPNVGVTSNTKRKNKSRKDKEVKGYEHSRKRKNLPTDQTSRNMDSTDAEPVPYNLPRNSSPPPPCLQWDRNQSESTPAGPLYIHEKLHPSAFAESLKRNKTVKLDSFFEKYDGLEEGQEFEWYQHRGNWQNRIIRGESRHVMASLLAKEGMAGKVQTIYFDPPYGINFRNILQANVNKNKDKDDMPNDPVAVQTFRDMYKNGIHSYLDNIYQIVSHTREMLADSGSFFLQIGSANVNIIGVLLDEVFGADNRMGLITLAKTSGSSTSGLPDVADYLLWYAKDKKQAKYHQLYESIPTRKDMLDLMGGFAMVEMSNGIVRKLNSEEKNNLNKLPKGARLFRKSGLTSQHHSKTRSIGYKYEGKTFKCPQGSQWRVGIEGLDKLAEIRRLIVSNTIRLKIYEEEIPGRRRNNIWSKQEYAQDQHYVVETAESTIEKCILMTTDPGDLVFDPTCGSGTTAYVAEEWGRRWITSDASLVAVNLARQRIVTGVFPWNTLIDSQHGHQLENELREKAQQVLLPSKNTYGEDPSIGFVYERMPHVSAQFLAYPDREAPIDYMVDRPKKDTHRLRVSSPFTIESLSPYRYVDPKLPLTDHPSETHQNIIAALCHTGIRIGDSNICLPDLEEYSGKTITHTATFKGQKACILVANDDCTVPQIMVDRAAEEAVEMPSVKTLIIVAFAYEPGVRNETRGRLNIYKAMANQDLQLGNLENREDDIAFILVGEPDIQIEINGNRATAEVIGYDTFNPASGNTKHKTIKERTENDIYCWMIDTDYDGRSFFARRVHFPGAIEDLQVKGFHKKLEKHIDSDLWDSTLSLKSAPFNLPKSGRIAVKIITATHTEMTTILDVPSKNRSK